MNLEDLFEGSLSLPDRNETDALAALPACRGVLLFTDPAGRPLRLTYCANLRRTAQTRLQGDSDQPTRSADLASVTERVWYLPCRTEYESFRQHIHLARRIFASSSDEYVSLPPAHCVYADPQERWGGFACCDQPMQKPSADYFGLFPSRKHADAFAQAWNTVFGLCRNRWLALAGKGRQCSYLQMGLCPGPCLDGANEAMYRRTQERAIEAASRPAEKTANLLRIEMKQKAAAMEYEQAHLLKKQVESLEGLAGGAYRWTSNLRDLRVVHIDRSCFRRRQGRRKVPLFCIYAIDARQAELRQEITVEPPADTGEEPETAAAGLPELSPRDHLGLLSYYLYRSNPPGLWMYRSQYESKSPGEVHNLIRSVFPSGQMDSPSSGPTPQT